MELLDFVQQRESYGRGLRSDAEIAARVAYVNYELMRRAYQEYVDDIVFGLIGEASA